MKQGKRYWFYINNWEPKIKSGLFTGEYNANGHAVLVTKTGERWAIPIKDLFNKDPRGKVRYT